MKRKSTEDMVEIPQWKPQVIPGSELTKRCWKTQHCGMGQTLHSSCFCPHASHSKQGWVGQWIWQNWFCIGCKVQVGFSNQVQSTEHLQDCAISPQPYKYLLNAFGNKQHLRLTHSMCKAARALPHFVFSQASLWIWWIKPVSKTHPNSPHYPSAL